MTTDTDKAARAAWLAEHVMEWHLRDDDTWPRKWWYAAGDAIGRYLVSGSSGGGTAWNPFTDIAQAKEVQEAMRARGYRVRILSTFPGEHDDDARYGVAFEQGRDGTSLVESATEAAAICNAAGAAMGWPFGKEEA